MLSSARTVEHYLAELPEPRRTVITAVRAMVNRHLPKGYAESIAFGMIGWGIPLARYPKTYNGQPLGYVALAAQKHYNTLYLMGVYADSAQERALRDGYAARGLKLDFGKCCLRFRDDALPPEEVVGPIIASLGVDELIGVYEAARAAPRVRSAARQAGAKPASAAKKSAAAKKAPAVRKVAPAKKLTGAHKAAAAKPAPARRPRKP